jgi:hypothetical protein
MTVNLTKVVPIDQMSGDSDDETLELRQLYQRASDYLSSFKWCQGIEEANFGLGVSWIIAVFLFRIKPAMPGVNRLLWVVVGDTPSAYLVTNAAPNPACALSIYIDLMRDWVDAVYKGNPVDDLFPVNVPPTVEWAKRLEGRLDKLQDEYLLPGFAEDLKECDSASAVE